MILLEGQIHVKLYIFILASAINTLLQNLILDVIFCLFMLLPVRVKGLINIKLYSTIGYLLLGITHLFDIMSQSHLLYI